MRRFPRHINIFSRVAQRPPRKNSRNYDSNFEKSNADAKKPRIVFSTSNADAKTSDTDAKTSDPDAKTSNADAKKLRLVFWKSNSSGTRQKNLREHHSHYHSSAISRLVTNLIAASKW